MGAVQRLADIDVAEPGNDALIEQCRFQARLFAATGCRQHRGIKGIAEWLRTKPAQKRLTVELFARNKLHRTEAARIVEGHARAGRQMEYDVIVGEMLAALVVVTAELFVLGFFADKDIKRSGHAEMHNKDVARR